MMNRYDNITPSRPRSMSQPSSPVSSSLPPPVYSSLPPLSPSPSSYRRNSLLPPIPARSNFTSVSGHTLPPRKSHKRSNSDIIGINSMIPQSTPDSDEEVMKEVCTEFMNLTNNNVSNGNENVEDLMITRSDSEGENNANESGYKTRLTTTLGLKRRAGKDIEPLRRHYRSVSMDSCFNDYLKPKNPPGKVSSTNSVDGNENAFSLEFGKGEYTADELKKIVGSKKLLELASDPKTSDPKRVKKILANREAAARAKERKTQYVANMELRVQTLENENTSVSTKIMLLEKNKVMMMNENKEMRIRIESLEQQAQLRDALTENLRAEIERLKAVTMLNEQESVEAQRLKEAIALNEQLSAEMMQNRDQLNRSTMQTMDPNMFQQLTINQFNFNQPQTNPYFNGQS